jgi:hypothetical protein
VAKSAASVLGHDIFLDAETERKTAEVELAPEALAIALETWCRHLFKAQ